MAKEYKLYAVEYIQGGKCQIEKWINDGKQRMKPEPKGYDVSWNNQHLTMTTIVKSSLYQ